MKFFGPLSKATAAVRLQCLSILPTAILAACGGGADTLDQPEAIASASPAATSTATEDAEARKLSKISLTPTSTTQSASSTPAESGSWTQCAREGERCEFSGRREVRYTAADGPAVRQIVKVAEGGVMCADGPFGAAATTYENLCFVSDATTTAPLTVLLESPTSLAATPTTSATTTTSTTASASAPVSATAGPRVGSFTVSGPITATSGQVISGMRIQNPGGACITVPAGVTGVVVRDSEIGPCGGSGYMAGNVVVRGQATIENNRITQGVRGVAAERTSGIVIRNNVFDTFRGPHPMGKAVELNYMTGALVEGNLFRGSDYATDVLSAFESRNMQYIGNDFDVHIAEPTSAAFTMGDGTGGDPGGNNYVARNVVRQHGTGVPAGVFGSSGNTVLEKNCFTAGLQAYNYAGRFDGVTVRNNVIGPGSFVPDTSIIDGWSTNILNSTDCSRVPA